MMGVYSTDLRHQGRMLAFGADRAACLAQLAHRGLDDRHELRCVCVTDALAQTDGRHWLWLPGSQQGIACTVDEGLRGR